MEGWSGQWLLATLWGGESVAEDEVGGCELRAGES